jgi:tripartite-type tricarboxylate transporter receptor subunit TctC
MYRTKAESCDGRSDRRADPVHVRHDPRRGAARAVGKTARARGEQRQALDWASGVPTIAEAGIPRFDATSWNGVFVPAGTPRAIIDKIHDGVVRALQTPEARERLTNDGAEPVGSTPEQFAAFVRAEMAKWGKVIKAAGLKID